MTSAPRRRWLGRMARWSAAAALAAMALASRPGRVLARPRALRAVALAIPPYATLDPGGRKSGLFVEAIELVARESQHQIEIIVAPYARAIAMLRSGAADLMIATSNSAVAEAAEPMGMLWATEVIAIGRAGLKLDGLQDLRNRTVGMLRGSDYGAAFLDDHQYRKHEITDQLQGIRMLLEGRLDASIGTRLAVFHAMRLLGVPRARLGGSLAVQSREIHLHLSRHNTDEALASELRRAVQELRSSGKADALLAKYLAGLPAA
ncbi:substrate-binding periplasmic protein [Pseudoduganella sp. HUAS MS19]